MKNTLITSSIACLVAAPAALAQVPEQEKAIETVVVTGIVMSEASTLSVDPKQLRQPAPAHDGAEYLKQLPGFSVVRKGGSGGDPSFRGMAASRLTIVNDDGMLLGGCGSRMDPPTAYITPQNYDRMVIVKGPQSTRYLPAAATVRFERDHSERLVDGLHGQAGVTLGSFGKREMNLDAQYAAAGYYGRFRASTGESDNYRDGEGREVNSRYDRQSFNTELGYRGDVNQLSLSLTQSMGEAAYADRSMDGVRFDRQQWQLRWVTELPVAWQNSVEFTMQQADIDHVMDNYSLRDFTPSMMRPEPAAMNPTRETESGRLELTLEPSDSVAMRLGADASQNQHAIRMSMLEYSQPYSTKPLLNDGNFEQRGMFAEVDLQLSENWWWFGGLRRDAWQAEDQRKMLMPNPMTMSPNPTFGEVRDENLHSGFSRFEYHADGIQAYLGYGQGHRFPDYWELFGKARSTPSSASALFAGSENLKQWDVGVLASGENWQMSASAYVGTIDDYLLIAQVSPMLPEQVRNIEARVWGGEIGGELKPFDALALRGSLAVSRGTNVTDDRYLPQVAPAELTLTAEYALNDWKLVGTWRAVAAQRRFALNEGTIVALDTAPSQGFSTLSVSASRQWQQWSLDTGIDNVTDKTYQEFLSTNAAAISGFETLPRVPEPGRAVWAKVTYRF